MLYVVRYNAVSGPINTALGMFQFLGSHCKSSSFCVVCSVWRMLLGDQLVPGGGFFFLLLLLLLLVLLKFFMEMCSLTMSVGGMLCVSVGSSCSCRETSQAVYAKVGATQP